MTNEEIAQKVQYLREQREGKITGGYRDLLANTYNYIKNLIESSRFDYCNPYDSEICKAIYGNTYHISMIQKFIRNLNQMKYIEIVGRGSDRKFKILKELDF